MRFFGTDGIRGLASSLLASDVAYALGRALSSECKKIAVARDVRLSSPALERRLIAGLLEGGAEILLCGVLPTPALSRIAESHGCGGAVMITASHNPPEYNGLKVFGAGGGKPEPDEEERLDDLLSAGVSSTANESEGKITVFGGAAAEYKNRLLSIFPRMDGEKIRLDCAHGCTSNIAAGVFERLGAEVIVDNGDGDGRLVNVNSGATSVAGFAARCGDSLGFSFDGDGDRVIAVVDGAPYDGDQILYALAKYYLHTGSLAGNGVVGTVTTNGALERELNVLGVKLVRTKVGDKYVLDKMKEDGLTLGGETSGHIVLADKGKTGDGLATALALVECKRFFGALPRFAPYPSYTYNLPAQNPEAALSSPEFKEKLRIAEKTIKGRFVVRASGTEPAVRITVECEESGIDIEKTVKKLFMFKNPQI